MLISGPNKSLIAVNAGDLGTTLWDHLKGPTLSLHILNAEVHVSSWALDAPIIPLNNTLF